MKRKSVAYSGVFLIALGSVSLVFELWYALIFGITLDIRYFIRPELSGDLLWLISVSLTMIVLGIIFIFFARQLTKEQK